MMSERSLSYSRQVIDEDDIAAVGNVLRGDWLTTGPTIDLFEAALAKEVGAKYAVVCNSGTAALYLAVRAVGLQPGDVVIVPTITFVATASASILAGLDVVFADVDGDTGLMTVATASEALQRAGKARARAILPVHLGGRVDDLAALHAFAREHELIVIEDACHALGTRYSDGLFQVGACEHSLAACFSFHPVKSIAMGEGGAVTTNSAALAEKMRVLRNHGIKRDVETMTNGSMAVAASGNANPWYYEVAEPSHNFRASDINCALGLSQLGKLGRFLEVRKTLMAHYEMRLAPLASAVRLVASGRAVQPGWHLCAVLVEFERIGIERRRLMEGLKARGIGTQVHYIPVHKQPFYSERCGDIDLPGAWSYYSRTLSLPLFPTMTESDVDRVVDALASQLRLGSS